jgi:hypothetical protein
MPTEIVRLLGFEGPNLYGPQPGVFLQLRADVDHSRRIKAALKDGGQRVGMVIAYLDVTAAPAEGGYLISATFATPTPQIGVELARYVVAGLNAAETSDETWDEEGPLWALQKRRRAEALPLPALQVCAEASQRGVPTLLRRDGLVQLGYGARSWCFDPAVLRTRDRSASDTLAVPWERVGPIPIVAVAGGAHRDSAARLIAAALAARQVAVRFAAAADFDATQALLTDPAAAIVVAGLTAEGIAQRGLAFERCAFSAVTDLPARLPPGIADREELARVLGVPMLVTDPRGCVVLNADVPEIAALAAYAPCPVICISALEPATTIDAHRARGGAALFVRDGLLVAASGAHEQAIARAAFPPAGPLGALAALALLWTMGLEWEQLLPALRAGGDMGSSNNGATSV